MYDRPFNIADLSNPIISLQEKYKLTTEPQLPSAEVILRRAAAMGSLNDVKKLLKHATNLNINAVGAKNARAAIHWAALKGHVQIFWEIVRHGGDVDLKDGFLKSAADYAKEKNITAIISRLDQIRIFNFLPIDLYEEHVLCYLTHKDILQTLKINFYFNRSYRFFERAINSDYLSPASVVIPSIYRKENSPYRYLYDHVVKSREIPITHFIRAASLINMDRVERLAWMQMKYNLTELNSIESTNLSWLDNPLLFILLANDYLSQETLEKLGLSTAFYQTDMLDKLLDIDLLHCLAHGYITDKHVSNYFIDDYHQWMIRELLTIARKKLLTDYITVDRLWKNKEQFQLIHSERRDWPPPVSSIIHKSLEDAENLEAEEEDDSVMANQIRRNV